MVAKRKLESQMKPVNIPREHVPCALCKDDDTVLLFEISGQSLPGVYVDGVFRPVAGRERIVRCRKCGLVYVNPRRAPAPGIQTYLPEQEWAYFQATRANRQVGNDGLLRRIEKLLGGPGRLLDVGCGDGLLLAQAQRRGWEPWGLEVSDELISRIHEECDLPHIFHGVLSAAEYPPDHFDAVLLIGVLEHLHTPAETMANVTRVTRPGGVVAVHTPNVDSLAARWRGPAWHHYEPLEHFYYFSADTLSTLLEISGLTLIGSFALHGTSKVKRWLLTAAHWLGLRMDNGLGLLARRQI
jgi:2-polyprenyl-3-methyl-5-hydroxy-6-metoxy-1,4-benzoquinol methylase